MAVSLNLIICLLFYADLRRIESAAGQRDTSVLQVQRPHPSTPRGEITDEIFESEREAKGSVIVVTEQ